MAAARPLVSFAIRSENSTATVYIMYTIFKVLCLAFVIFINSSYKGAGGVRLVHRRVHPTRASADPCQCARDTDEQEVHREQVLVVMQL